MEGIRKTAPEAGIEPALRYIMKWNSILRVNFNLNCDRKISRYIAERNIYINESISFRKRSQNFAFQFSSLQEIAFLNLRSTSLVFLSFSFACRFRPRSCRRNSANRCSNPLFVGRARHLRMCVLAARFFLSLPSRRVRLSSCSLSSSQAPFAPSEVARRRRDRSCESRKSRLEESPRMSQSR